MDMKGYWMSNNTECANYFKSKKEYHRCMEACREKWKSLGRVGGSITLSNTNDEERRAIGGILGKNFQDKDIHFDFNKFEQGLQKTCFAPIDMKKVLEAYFDEPMYTNQGEKKAQEEQKRAFFQGLSDNLIHSIDGESAAILWVQGMLSDKKYGYQQLVREYKKDSHQAAILAKNVGNALVQLENTKESDVESPLSIFAAKISGNPHYFDRGSTPGQLLQHAICFWKKSELPKNAHQWRELLFKVGIVPDNVSSILHAYGLHLQTKEGWHPAYEAFCRLHEPYVITMENLKGIIGAMTEGDEVYVVENEMVFCYLLEHAEEEIKKRPVSVNTPNNKNLTLLCTSGQFRTVALELVPLILNSGSEIYYSGDIDPDGIRIADRLWQKFGNGIHIWRMSPEDYDISISKEYIDNNGLVKLENIQHPLLKKTAENVKEKKRAAYQENLLKELLDDIWHSFK